MSQERSKTNLTGLEGLLADHLTKSIFKSMRQADIMEVEILACFNGTQITPNMYSVHPSNRASALFSDRVTVRRIERMTTGMYEAGAPAERALADALRDLFELRLYSIAGMLDDGFIAEKNPESNLCIEFDARGLSAQVRYYAYVDGKKIKQLFTDYRT